MQGGAVENAMAISARNKLVFGSENLCWAIRVTLESWWSHVYRVVSSFRNAELNSVFVYQKRMF